MLELLTDWNPIVRGLIAFAIAFGVTLAIGNKVILKLISLKLGQPVRSKEEVNELFDLHGKKAGTPTMGGVMILATMVLAILLAADLTNPYIHVCTFVLLGLGVLGFKDDYAKVAQGNSKGVSSKFKLAWQFGVAAIAAVWVYYCFDLYPHPSEEVRELIGIQLALESGLLDPPMAVTYAGVDIHPTSLFIPGVGTYITLGVAMIALFIIVIVGSSNAVNLTDGLDGLASGCTITTAGAFAIVSLFSSGYFVSTWVDFTLYNSAAMELFIFCLAMVGSVTGFLWFNAYPARVFMGDTGSLALGGAIGAVAICCKQELILVVIGFVFVAEALSVMLQVGSYKLRGGKRIFKCAPVHHHFELIGWKETQVITRFWIVSGICAVLGIAILFI